VTDEPDVVDRQLGEPGRERFGQLHSDETDASGHSFGK
jgi:hypothetical protein